MAKILIYTDPPFQPWLDLFLELLPEFDAVTPNHSDDDRQDVRHAFVWNPSPGTLGRYPNLRSVVSIGAGVDGILADTSLPAGIPVYRNITCETERRMADFALMACILVTRGMLSIAKSARGRQWQTLFDTPMPEDSNVLVLGQGPLGLAVAHRLAENRFNVRAWSRSGRATEGFEVISGKDRLVEALGAANVLVNLLPLTEATVSILDRAFFSRLRKGAFLIHLGRGEHLDERALIDALATGKLQGAVIDVLAQEPPSPEHPFHAHPGILMTGHNAAVVSRRARARRAADIFRLLDRGETAPGALSREKGY